MGDYQAALERLVADPGFVRALATDPAAALAGYRLTPAERAVLATTQTSIELPVDPDADAGGTGGDAEPEAGLGRAPAKARSELDDGRSSGFGAAPPEEPAHAGGRAYAEPPRPRAQPPAEVPLPEGYQTRVDVDGDGRWDPHTLRARPDGGVDILVDSDSDGRAEWVGHDDDADRLIEWAEYDTTGDGTLDTRYYDDNGDGWLDRAEPADS